MEGATLCVQVLSSDNALTDGFDRGNPMEIVTPFYNTLQRFPNITSDELQVNHSTNGLL